MIMDTLAANLKSLRKQAGLTQTQLADMTGIPRASLAAMERPGANPGISSVLLLSEALGVTVDELVLPNQDHRYYKVPAHQAQEWRDETGRFISRIVSPIASRGVQVQLVTLEPQCDSIGRPHPRGSQEFFTCLRGTAHIRIADETVSIETGALVQFPGHLKHVYQNHSANERVEACSIVVIKQ